MAFRGFCTDLEPLLEVCRFGERVRDLLPGRSGLEEALRRFLLQGPAEEVEWFRKVGAPLRVVPAKLLQERQQLEQLVAAARTLERYQGALVGLAAGDALSTALEFKLPGSFTPIDDMVGGGPFGLAKKFFQHHLLSCGT